MKPESTNSYKPKLINLETIMDSLSDIMQKLLKSEVTAKQGNSINTILSAMIRIVKLESELSTKSPPELIEKVKQIREKTTARIMKFKEKSPDVQVAAFEEWLKIFDTYTDVNVQQPNELSRKQVLSCTYKLLSCHFINKLSGVQPTTLLIQ